jgi:hypothetical protein
MSAVTVVLPVYNGARFLRGAIDSLLVQTYRDFELLVIDDGSHDESAEIAHSYERLDTRVRVLRNETNQGLARTLNRGLDEARAELVARQDADDVSHPRRLETQVAFLQAHRDVALVGAQGWEIDATGHHVGRFDKPREAEGIAWTMMFDNAFLHTSVLFRRDAVRSAGGYDPAYAYCQDYELWSRLLRRHRAANVRERLVACLLHGASMTETTQREHRRQSDEVMAREQERHLGAAASAADLELLAEIRAGVAPAHKARVLEQLRRMRATYASRHPAALSSSDFRRTVARQWGHVLAAHRFQPLPLVLAAAFEMGVRYPVLPTLLRRASWAARKRLSSSS